MDSYISVRFKSTSQHHPRINEAEFRNQGDMYIKYLTLTRSRLLATRIVDNELLVEARPGERGEMKRMLERELKVLGVAERAVKRITCTLQRASLAWLSGFQFLAILGGYSGKPCQTSLGVKKTRQSYAFKIGTTVLCCAGLAAARMRDSCSGYAGFRRDFDF